MSVSVTLKSYFYEVLIPSSQKNTSSPIEDILHHVSISFMKKLALYKCFNPRTHTGCDINARSNDVDNRSFNPRTHTGCDFLSSVLLTIKSMFQSTHPHGVRLMFFTFTDIFPYVSIHAPTRGATSVSGLSIRPILSFNPRTHTGCDRFKDSGLSFSEVSIHAPTRGATLTHRRYLETFSRFNPRTHTGCDNNAYMTGPNYVRFNPRTHTGCDDRIGEEIDNEVVSIHAPTRGATLHSLRDQLTDRFQSTHPHGVRHIA